MDKETAYEAIRRVEEKLGYEVSEEDRRRRDKVFYIKKNIAKIRFEIDELYGELTADRQDALAIFQAWNRLEKRVSYTRLFNDSFRDEVLRIRLENGEEMDDQDPYLSKKIEEILSEKT